MSRSAHDTLQNQQQWQADIGAALPIIDDRLYFTMTKCPRNTKEVHMFSIDHALKYEPFFVDFGPLNLACLYKFCKLVEHKLKDKKYRTTKIYYYCDRTPQRVSNAAYLIGCYQLIELHRKPQEAYRRIKSLAEKGVPFRDASMGLCTYHCNVPHCINAVYNALQWNYLDFSTFNVDEYERFERVECGDLNILVPNKFVAFAGPYFKEFDEEGYPALTPDFYIPIWRKLGVTTVIRLNKKCYDKRVFTKAGFAHHDMYFIDGTTPSDEIVAHFNAICEGAQGVLAVHCKAGLGRTGSCIGCYMMKHYVWTAHQVIAWLRICRPGSVIGPQQQFLEMQQPKMWRAGDVYRQKHGIELSYDQRAKRAPKNSKVVSGVSGVSGANEQSEQKDLQHRHSNNGNGNGDAEEKSDAPLATDPGQNQGSALRHAKAQAKAKTSNSNNNHSSNSAHSKGKGNSLK